MNNYPFIRCLNPRTIVNPHTNENLLVSCGKCEVCQLQKSAMSSLKCQLETLTSTHVRFVTLTYNNFFIPRMIALTGDNFDFNVDSPNHFIFVDNHNRDEIISETCITTKQLHSLQSKVTMGNYLPYLRKTDLQLFIKRLRKHLSKYTNEKIRYYAVGEYGPVHFRPHYHLLLWFEGNEAISHIRKAIRASWRFGRIDVQTPIGDCSRYVAGYLNGSCHLPSIYQKGKCQPFSCHSFFLGQKFLLSTKEEVYAMPTENFIKRCVPINGTIKEIYVWKALKTTYFPKCSRFSISDYDSLIRTYRIYKEVSDELGKKSPIELARTILSSVLDDANLYPFTIFFMKRYNFDKFRLRSETFYITIFRKIYLDLLLSKRFLYSCCDNPSLEETYRIVNIIINFYKDIDRLNLTAQLKSEEEYFYEHSIDDLVFFDTKFFNEESNIEKFKDSISYKCFKEANLRNYLTSTKKKKLNDLNKLLYDF